MALARFADAEGSFYDTADDATDAALALVRRPQDPTDSAYPSGTSAIAGALVGYAALTGSDVHRQAGLQALRAAAAAGASAPSAFGWALACRPGGPGRPAAGGGGRVDRRSTRPAPGSTAPRCAAPRPAW